MVKKLPYGTPLQKRSNRRFCLLQAIPKKYKFRNVGSVSNNRQSTLRPDAGFAMSFGIVIQKLRKNSVAGNGRSERARDSAFAVLQVVQKSKAAGF